MAWPVGARALDAPGKSIRCCDSHQTYRSVSRRGGPARARHAAQPRGAATVPGYNRLAAIRTAARRRYALFDSGTAPQASYSTAYSSSTLAGRPIDDVRRRRLSIQLWITAHRRDSGQRCRASSSKASGQRELARPMNALSRSLSARLGWVWGYGDKYGGMGMGEEREHCLGQRRASPNIA